MTAWTSTSTNALNLFGCPADNWAVFNWGSFLWGSGTADLPTQTRHLVTNALAPTEDSIGHAVRHLVTNALAPTSADQGFRVIHLVTNALAPTSDDSKRVIHLVTNALAPTSADQGFIVVKFIGNDIILSVADAENATQLIANSLGLSNDMAYEYLQDANNWNHVFPEGVSNAHLQSTQAWTATTSSAVTWATAIQGSTVWS